MTRPGLSYISPVARDWIETAPDRHLQGEQGPGVRREGRRQDGVRVRVAQQVRDALPTPLRASGSRHGDRSFDRNEQHTVALGVSTSRHREGRNTNHGRHLRS
jgi:hypothetical protein